MKTKTDEPLNEDFQALLKLQLNPLQKDILQELVCGENFLISVQAGWGSGKSFALVLSCLVWSIMRKGKREATLLVTDTLSRYKQVLHPALCKVLLPLGWENFPSEGRWTNGDHTIFCRAYFRPGTQDQSNNSLEGINASFATCDEAQSFTDNEVFQKMLGRIRAMQGAGQPKILIAGLPQYGAWWMTQAEQSGGAIIRATSHVNAANLPKSWFQAVKSLPENERLAMIENLPQPPQGSVFQEFNPRTHVVKGWTYRQELSSRISIDWGFQKPSVLFITHDPTLPNLKGGFGVDIVHREINPQNCTLDQLVKKILEIACPREQASLYPNTHILLDGGSCDKAGLAKSDQTGIENIRLIKRDISEGGIGLALRFTTDPVRTDIMNGVRRLKKLFEEGRLMLSEELWNEGLRKTQGNSLARAIASYRWASETKDIPKKDGKEDPLDALRYDVLNWNWRDAEKGGIFPPNVNAKVSPSTQYNKVQSFGSFAPGKRFSF